jgi:hypothetical protein
MGSRPVRAGAGSAGRHGGLPLDGELDWSGQKWPETGDCPICENPHELQEPIFLGANFQLEVDFWSTFGPFFGLRLFLGYFSLPFFRLVIVREMACFIGFSGFETPVLSPF